VIFYKLALFEKKKDSVNLLKIKSMTLMDTNKIKTSIIQPKMRECSKSTQAT